MILPIIAAATIVLTNSFGRAEIDVHGAHLRSYVPAGGEEVFLPVTEPDDSGWMSGGVPVCWPWFYDRGPAGAGLHGSARLKDFRVVKRSFDEAVLELVEGPLVLRMEFNLGRRLSICMITTNVGASTAKVTKGLHAYFAVPDVGKASLEGLDGVRCKTKRGSQVSRPIVCGPRVPLAGANDIYEVTNGVFTIDDESCGRRIKLDMSGMGELTAWNGRSCPRGAVCVEPIVLSSPLLISPGKKHELRMSVEVVGR